MSAYVYIIGMCLITAVIRILPLLVLRRPIQNRFLRSFFYYVPYVTLWKRGNELLYYAGPGNWQLYEETALTEYDGKVYLYKPNEGFIIINPDQLPPAEDGSIKLLIAIQDAVPTPPHATGILYYNTTEQKLYSSYSY